MTGFIKQIVRTFLGYFDLELRRINSPCRSFNIGAKNLGQLFRPRTVIDVGAARGTPDLYKHFSGAQFLLIEPLKVYETALQSMRDKFGAIVEICFCGSAPGEVTMYQFFDPCKSSAFRPLRSMDAVKIVRVPVHTLDEIVLKHNLEGPFLLKIDVEGAEMDVLEGARKTLDETECLIVEVSILPRFVGAPEAADVIGYLHTQGFVIFDILNPFDKKQGYLSQADLVFVRKNSPLRTPNTSDRDLQDIKSSDQHGG